MINELLNKKIAVICGGFSREREISLRSGENIYQALKELGYNAVKIDFAENQLLKDICDIAFIALHGVDGEDGIIQTLLEAQNIPYTGCGVNASVIGYNKYLTKKMSSLNKIPIPEYNRCYLPLSKLPSSYNFPVFLKPVNEGSSIDVFIVDDNDQLQEKTTYLADKYSQYLLEEYIQGKEVTVGIINNPAPKCLPILELRPKNRFYDFDAKYTKGLTDFILPAEIQ